jgi:hypothetical protein
MEPSKTGTATRRLRLPTSRSACASYIPLLAGEGWLRGFKRSREATLFRADGVVSSALMQRFAGLTTRPLH